MTVRRFIALTWVPFATGLLMPMDIINNHFIASALIFLAGALTNEIYNRIL